MPELSELAVPNVSFSVAEIPLRNQPVLPAVDRGVDAGLDRIRAIVGNELNLPEGEGEVVVDSVSHLIICNAQRGTDEVWYELTPAPMSAVRIRAWKIAYLLHDVALDIALFHAGPKVSYLFGETIPGKQEYSSLKAQFIKDSGTQTFFGDLDPHLSYVCLSAAVREGDDLDLREYIRTWQRFLRYVQSAQPVGWAAAERALDAARTSGFRLLWSELPFRGELSRTKVERAYRGLESGIWWFVITRQRPKGDRAEHLAHELGKEIWTRNTWRFVADGDEVRLNQFSQWLEFIGPLEVLP